MTTNVRNSIATPEEVESFFDCVQRRISDLKASVVHTNRLARVSLRINMEKDTNPIRLFHKREDSTNEIQIITKYEKLEKIICISFSEEEGDIGEYGFRKEREDMEEFVDDAHRLHMVFNLRAYGVNEPKLLDSVSIDCTVVAGATII